MPYRIERSFGIGEVIPNRAKIRGYCFTFQFLRLG